MKQDFPTADLKDWIERSLGFVLRSLDRLDGASALNFKAVRDEDGLTFAVKCSPPSNQAMFDRLVEHLSVLEGTKAVRRLFVQDLPPVFRGYNVICMSWCYGVRIFPDKLTDAQFLALLDDYLAFSGAMQRARLFGPCHPNLKWRDDALALCRGLGGWLLRRVIGELAPLDCAYCPDMLRVIHGDFHHGNFLFVNSQVDGYLDLEEFRAGYPPDDLLRYVVCATEHLRWYEQYRKRRMLHLFSLAVRHMPYSRHEWVVAINGLFLTKIHRSTYKTKKTGIGKALNLAWRARFYRKLRAIVEELLV